MMKKPKQSDIDFEIAFYEGVVGKKPDFLQALIMLGDLYTKKGCYEKGLDIDLRLAALRPKDPYILYNLACSYSLTGQVEAAFSAVKCAVENGYTDFRHMERDPDLNNLMNQHYFQRYFSGLKKLYPFLTKKP